MNQDSFDFKAAIKEVDEINRWFQHEEVDLDEGLVKFKRGMELIKKCQKRLEEVENQFTEIKKEFGADKAAAPVGQETPFD